MLTDHTYNPDLNVLRGLNKNLNWEYFQKGQKYFSLHISENTFCGGRPLALSLVSLPRPRRDHFQFLTRARVSESCDLFEKFLRKFWRTRRTCCLSRSRTRLKRGNYSQSVQTFMGRGQIFKQRGVFNAGRGRSGGN